jgi:hypothetical protein
VKGSQLGDMNESGERPGKKKGGGGVLGVFRFRVLFPANPKLEQWCMNDGVGIFVF